MFFLSDSLHNIFYSYDKKIFSEIRTIRIFHYFTDKSALNVHIRPHYYTVFPAFPQQILSRKQFFELISLNFLSNFPNTLWIQEPLHKLFGSGQLSVASGKFRWNVRARRPVLWYWPGNEPSALRIHDTNRASENPPGGSKVFSGNWNWAES